MNINDILRFWRYGNQLKRTARTGWVGRGVVGAESVAAHSHGVAFVALILAELTEEPLDLGRLLSLAILHDLPESVTTDIPMPAWQFLPAGIKPAVERHAIETMLADLPFAEAWLQLWEELATTQTLEAQLVKDADKLDLYLQALTYEQQQGNSQMAEFWERQPSFHTAPAAALYEALQKERQ